MATFLMATDDADDNQLSPSNNHVNNERTVKFSGTCMTSTSRWCCRWKRNKRKKPKPTISQIWMEAAAVASGMPMPAREHDEDQDSLTDMPKMASYRAHTATIAPLLLGMSGLGGAVIRRSKRRMSDFTDIAYLAESADGMHLTQRQMDLLKTTFRDNKDAKRSSPGSTLGEWVYNRMFTDCPELTGVSGMSPETTGNKSRLAPSGRASEHECYRHHCQMLTDAVDMALETLDVLDDCLGPLLVSYGAAHAKFEHAKDVQFRTDFWDILSDAMCDYGLTWKTKASRAEVMRAWRVVVFFFLTKMRQGYALELEAHTDTSQSDRS